MASHFLPAGATWRWLWLADLFLLWILLTPGRRLIRSSPATARRFLLPGLPIAAWSPDSTASVPVLASGSGGNNSVNIWNLGPDKNQIIYSGHTDAVLAVAWGDNLLASASKDQDRKSV